MMLMLAGDENINNEQIICTVHYIIQYTVQYSITGYNLFTDHEAEV